MILLTGASGFIGKHLVSEIVNIYGRNGVVALTSNPIDECPYIIHNQYNFDSRVFKTYGYADSISTIIHAGAFTPKNSSEANDLKNCNQNIYNLDKLLNTDLPNLKKIIYLSTLDVYGNSEIISEDSSINPLSLYGYSKLYGEKLVEWWAKSVGVTSQVLRIGHVYGPGEDAYQKIIPVTMKKLLFHEPIEIWGDGSDLRAFIYIKDIITAILNSILLKVDTGPINLVSNNSISIKKLVEQIVNISGLKSEIKQLPRRADPRSLRFNNDRMRKYLLPSEKPLSEGLSNEWDYMRKKFS